MTTTTAGSAGVAPGSKRYEVEVGGGVKRTLLVNLGALSLAEEILGESLIPNPTKALSSFRGLRAILFAGIATGEAEKGVEYSLAQFDDEVSLETLPALASSVVAAVKSALPAAGKGVAPATGATSPSARSRSSTSTSPGRKTSGSPGKTGAAKRRGRSRRG